MITNCKDQKWNEYMDVEWSGTQMPFLCDDSHFLDFKAKYS